MVRIVFLAALTVPPAWLQTVDALPQPGRLRGPAATRQLQSAGVADLLSGHSATLYADHSSSPSAAAQLRYSLYRKEYSANDNVVKLATFDGAAGTTHSWRDMNDPVMGGRSHSTFDVTPSGTGSFEGTCAVVPFLHA